MSRVRTRLEQYKAEIEKKSQYKHGLPGSALDIVNSLLDDLEQDEKEKGWIPVKYHQISEKERAEESISNDIRYMLDCKMPDDGQEITEKQHGKIRASLIVTDIILIAIMIGLRLRHGNRLQSHTRRAEECS